MSGYIQVCNKRSRQSEHQRSDIKSRNLYSMYEKMQASGLTEFIPFICISAIWGQILFLFSPCLLHSPTPSTITLGAGSICCIPGIPHSLVAQKVKHLPAIRETRIRSLGREDPLGKERATHSSTLTWKIP